MQVPQRHNILMGTFVIQNPEIPFVKSCRTEADVVRKFLTCIWVVASVVEKLAHLPVDVDVAGLKFVTFQDRSSLT